LTGTFEFDVQELDLLLEVCRTLDTIEALSGAIETDGLMITGSQGQLVLNSAVAELRQQQSSYARLVTMLNLGEAADGSSVVQVTTSKARAAANARWSRSKVARRA
jgi:hypothetical protein